MAFLKEVLRPRKPKPKKQPPKSNAQKLREHKARIKADPVLYAEWKEKKKEDNQRRRANLTEEQKKIEREKARLRQQICRERKKAAEGKSHLPERQKKTNIMKNTCITRIQAQKAAEKRERNRLGQQKRRANVSVQKRTRVNEKRRERYHSRKQSQPTQSRKIRVHLDTLLRGVQQSLKKSRTKLTLFKMNFLKKILSHKDPENHTHPDSFYKRPSINNFAVEHFLDKNSIDFPGLRGSTTQKKVLTKTTLELLQEFKKAHPDMKMSLTTFKRRRPNHIVLSSSRKFLQCLCEKCTNIILIANVLNPYLDKRNERMDVRMTDRISSVEDLVERTLCLSVRRNCWDRKCSKCEVEPLIDGIRRAVGDRGSEVRKWSRWERTEKSSKDLVHRESTISEIIVIMEGGLECMAKHLKTAQWQRKIYQDLKQKLPKFHAICTIDFAENYVCKFQNEIQSAHWSYRQVSVHPCGFFYHCQENGCSKLITEYVIFLSDDLNHDCFFYQTYY